MADCLILGPVTCFHQRGNVMLPPGPEMRHNKHQEGERGSRRGFFLLASCGFLRLCEAQL